MEDLREVTSHVKDVFDYSSEWVLGNAQLGDGNSTAEKEMTFSEKIKSQMKSQDFEEDLNED